MWLLAGNELLWVLAPKQVKAAEFSLKPSLSVSEEYNSNLLLTSENQKEEYITHVVPEIVLHYRTPFWLWDIDYAPEYRTYAKHTVEDQWAHMLRVRNHTELIDNHLFLDLKEDRERISRDITRDFAGQSYVVNNVERNIYSINPYAIITPSTNTSLQPGYIYKNTHIFRDARYFFYDTSTAIRPVVNRTNQIGYADFNARLFSGVTFTAGGLYNNDENNVEDYEQLEGHTGLEYAYAPGSRLYAQIAGHRFDFENDPDPNRHFLWNAGLSQRLSSFKLTLDRTSLYVQDPERVLTRQDRLRTAISRDTTRMEFKLSQELNKYRDGKTDALITTSQDTLASILYRFTERTTATLSAGYQKLRDEPSRALTDINTDSIRLEHLLNKNFTMNLEYQYLRSHSWDVETNNYINHRFFIGIKKNF